MSLRRIYCPDNVWIIRFNGLSEDPEAEPVTVCNKTRWGAMEDFAKIVERLKRSYPNTTWFDDSKDAHNKTELRLESVENPRVFVHAERVKFIDGGCVFYHNETQEEIRAWTKGIKK